MNPQPPSRFAATFRNPFFVLTAEFIRPLPGGPGSEHAHAIAQRALNALGEADLTVVEQSELDSLRRDRDIAQGALLPPEAPDGH